MYFSTKLKKNQIGRPFPGWVDRTSYKHLFLRPPREARFEHHYPQDSFYYQQENFPAHIREFFLPAWFFLLSAERIFITNFLICITNLVICVTSFVTSVTNFVIKISYRKVKNIKERGKICSLWVKSWAVL